MFLQNFLKIKFETEERKKVFHLNVKIKKLFFQKVFFQKVFVYATRISPCMYIQSVMKLNTNGSCSATQAAPCILIVIYSCVSTNVAHFSIYRACEKCILDGYVVYINTIMVHACMYTCMTLTYFLNNGKHCIDVKFSIKTILRLLDNL